MNSSHLHTHTHKCVPGTAAAADRSTEVVARQVGHGQRPPGQRSLSLSGFSQVAHEAIAVQCTLSPFGKEKRVFYEAFLRVLDERKTRGEI